MKRKIQLAIGLAVMLVIAAIFYKFFPSIWGEAVYPLEYKDEILAASKEFNVDRNLIAAVIYSESHFNPNAGSGAGARGLMQLMPATARGIAAQIKLTDYIDSALTNPKTNIRLGTAYLKQQLDKYGGDVGAALAHYNGGPAAGGNYAAGRRDLLPRETQNYTRNVQSVKAMYDQIYGPDWSGGTLPFSPPPQAPTVVQIFRLDNLINILFGRNNP